MWHLTIWYALVFCQALFFVDEEYSATPMVIRVIIDQFSQPTVSYIFSSKKWQLSEIKTEYEKYLVGSSKWHTYWIYIER
jgi:hypothetical protein